MYDENKEPPGKWRLITEWSIEDQREEIQRFYGNSSNQ